MRIELHPEARAEIRAAALWYEERDAHLGDAFLDEVAIVFEKIRADPYLFPQWIGTEHVTFRIRKALVERFPYAVGFEQQESVCLVLSVAHQKRRPLYWLKRAGEEPG